MDERNWKKVYGHIIFKLCEEYEKRIKVAQRELTTLAPHNLEHEIAWLSSALQTDDLGGSMEPEEVDIIVKKLQDPSTKKWKGPKSVGGTPVKRQKMKSVITSGVSSSPKLGSEGEDSSRAV